TRLRRFVQDQGDRVAIDQTWAWSDESLGRDALSQHLYDGNHAAVEFAFRHYNSLCHHPCAPVCARNGITGYDDGGDDLSVAFAGLAGSGRRGLCGRVQVDRGHSDSTRPLL